MHQWGADRADPSEMIAYHESWNINLINIWSGHVYIQLTFNIILNNFKHEPMIASHECAWFEIQ